MKKLLNRFIDGLVFGLGFSIALAVVLYVGAYMIPPFLQTHSYSTVYPVESDFQEFNATDFPNPERYVNFDELSIEEKIDLSSVIFIAKYEEDKSGNLKAIIYEFLKKNKDVKFDFSIGDEYPRSSVRNPRDGITYGTGRIVFCVGSPASMQLATTIDGDVAFIEGDMPLYELRELINK